MGNLFERNTPFIYCTPRSRMLPSVIGRPGGCLGVIQCVPLPLPWRSAPSSRVLLRVIGGQVGAWGSFSCHCLVPVSALVPARHPRPVRYHCSPGNPHHHLPSHGRYNVDKPSLPGTFHVELLPRFSSLIEPFIGQPMLPSVVGGPGGCLGVTRSPRRRGREVSAGFRGQALWRF
jgi:hypothetical protein